VACKWPEGTCACYAQQAEKPDHAGRIWMHCEEGLNLSKASMSRFVMHCLTNRIEIGSIYPFDPDYLRSQVSVAVRLKAEQFYDFERVTGGKLRKPPLISLNSSSPETIESKQSDG
jgi:hypothetical protein